MKAPKKIYLNCNNQNIGTDIWHEKKYNANDIEYIRVDNVHKIISKLNDDICREYYDEKIISQDKYLGAIRIINTIAEELRDENT